MRCSSARSSVFLPMVVLLQAAFAKAWGRGFSLDNLTLHNFHYISVRADDQAQQAIAQHLRCIRRHRGVRCDRAGAGDRLCGAARKLVPLRQRAGLPGDGAVRRSRASCWRSASMPPIAGRRLRCTAPAAILILAFTTRFLPIAYRRARRGMRSINPEMEEAVRILGGGRLHRDPQGRGAAAEAKPARRLHPGVHPATRELSPGDLPGRAARRA